MHTVAAQIAGECTSTDIFKEKLTQIEEVKQAKPGPTKRSSKTMLNQRIREKKKEWKARGNNGHTNVEDKPIARHNAREVNTQLSCSGCKN
jgi:hypothetical protein